MKWVALITPNRQDAFRNQGEAAITLPQPIDFKKIIAELEAVGVTVHKISLMMHRQWAKVDRWKHGQQPKHYEGQMLLSIHAEYVHYENEVCQQHEGQIAA